MYGGQAAAKLGLKATAVTIGADDIEEGMNELEKLGLDVKRIHRNTSNNFSNTYSGDTRKAYMRSTINSPLTPEDLPENTHDFNCVILFPLFHEITSDIFARFSTSQLILLDPTGFLRRIGEPNESGLFPVSTANWENMDEFVGKVDVLKLSDDDMANIDFPEGVSSDEGKIQYLHKQGFPLVILTRAAKSTLVVGDNLDVTEVPTLAVDKVVDPAGAGEVFAVAFMHKYFLTRNPVESVTFGNACAGLKIAGKDY